MFASGHFDKGPMILVHTAGSSMPGPPRKRVHRWYDSDAKRVKRVALELLQPDTHARYRGSFWAVDRFNRMAFGPEGVHRTVRVKGWHRRFFLALLSATVLNAYMAYNQVQQTSVLSYTKFKHQLAMEMLAGSGNATRGQEQLVAVRSSEGLVTMEDVAEGVDLPLD